MSKLTDKFPYLREVLIGSGSGLVVLTLIIGGFAVSSDGQSAAPAPSESPTETATVEPTPTASETPMKTCSVSEEASNPSLGTLQAVVLNAETGEILYDRDANKPAATASVMKTLTAAAALMTVGPNFRATTKVFSDPQSKTVISLVGGGDVTLSKTKAGAQSVYRDAPKL